jgi:hypothetical protein
MQFPKSLFKMLTIVGCWVVQVIRVRGVVLFNFALTGLFLAAAYLLHPRCCEHSNTFCLALIPHLSHHSTPPIARDQDDIRLVEFK